MSFSKLSKTWAGLIAAVMLLPKVQSQETQGLDTLELDDVVITGTKYAVPVEKSGKLIYKLSREDIEQNAGKSVPDLLHEVPGIQITGNFGTPGSNINYLVRGARSSQTLILIDGVPINDPSGNELTYDLRFLSADQIESIEVLKGGLSSLYGTNAAAAVINITLKKPEQKPFAGSVSLEGGSFTTIAPSASFSGTVNGIRYLASGSYSRSEGFSAAADEGNLGFDDDGFERFNVLAKIGYDFSDQFSVDGIFGYDQFDADFDGGSFFDSPTNTQAVDQIRVGIKPSFNYRNGQVALNALYNRNERDFLSTDFPSLFIGNNVQVEASNRISLSENITLLSGVNLQHLRYEQSDSISTTGQFGVFDDFIVTNSQDTSNFTIVDPYSSVVIDLPGGFTGQAGVRLNYHSEYGTEFLYNVNPSYLVSINPNFELKAFGSVSSSFVTPSLFQLFSPFGNANLEPEDVFAWEIGFSLYLSDRFEFNTAYFNRDEENPIGFDAATFAFANIAAERQVEGVDLDFSWKILQDLRFRGNYAFVTSDVDASLLRIPNHTFGLSLDYSGVKNTFFSAKLNYNGNRDDITFDQNFNTVIVPLENYTLVDVFASHDFQNLTVFGSINNIFDEDFIGLVGFTTRGRNFSVGIRYTIN